MVEKTMDPLDRDQVDYALQLIDELHPIAKTPMYVVYPSLRPMKNMMTWMPWMQYSELSEDPEHEMNDLLQG